MQLENKNLSILNHPRLKISSIVETAETSPQEKQEIKHENDQ